MKNYESFFVAKQPILDTNLSTYGYELLFRSASEQEQAVFDDPDQATLSVVTCGFVKSQEDQPHTKRIFINFTEKLLLDGAPKVLPPSVTVIEILESIIPSPELIDEIIRYKQDGYLIALDDYTGDNYPQTLMDLADIIKVDVLGISDQELAEICQTLEDKKALKLAEKVDNGKTYRKLRQLGFDLYQGYFFARPENLSGKTISPSQTSRIRGLAILQEPQLETDQIVALINSDPGIAYRLLRLLNSAAFGFSMKIESIQHAVVLLGNKRIKYWLQMVLMSDINRSHHPPELFHLALTRGKTLEELAVERIITDRLAETYFLFGLLSLLDVMLDIPFPEIFKKLPLPSDMIDGYLSETSELSKLLQILNALEDNDVKLAVAGCENLDIPTRAFVDASVRAHAWTELIMQDIL